MCMPGVEQMRRTTMTTTQIIWFGFKDYGLTVVSSIMMSLVLSVIGDRKKQVWTMEYKH